MTYESQTKIYLATMKVGEKFTNLIRTGKWKILGLSKYNVQAGTTTRLCEDLKTGAREQKECRVQVIPIK
jgi:hypothetical protein